MGEKKSFQEILDEQLTKAAKKSAPPAKEPKPAALPKFEFDFSFVAKAAPVLKVKWEAYPRAAAKPTPPSPLRPKDKIVETAGFSSVEVAAMETLGLPTEKNLSRNALKTKYRILVRALHPDHHAVGLSEFERRRLTERFQAVLEAYQVLEQRFSEGSVAA